MDAVATNAAAILATQVTLASSSMIVVHLVGRSGYYRRMRISDNAARISACRITGVSVTIFNIPNFVLIARSFENRKAVTYMRAPTIYNLHVSNYTAVVKIEGYAFVTVEGSSATAIIGLLLDCITFVIGVGATWHEFSKITKRR